MSVAVGVANLTQSRKVLQHAWEQTRSEWDDSAAQHFEEKLIEPMLHDLKRAVDAMSIMQAVIQQTRQACE
jgi:hypothetical protein